MVDLPRLAANAYTYSSKVRGKKLHDLEGDTPPTHTPYFYLPGNLFDSVLALPLERQRCLAERILGLKFPDKGLSFTSVTLLKSPDLAVPSPARWH